jgi:hypothetical protein
MASEEHSQEEPAVDWHPRTAHAPSAQRRHVGFGPGLIDADQARRIIRPLVTPPLGAPAVDIGPTLFAGADSLLRTQPSACTNVHIER